jgi:CHAT domain-containing protein
MRFLILPLILLFSYNLLAQSSKNKSFEEAERHFELGQFNEAYQLYQQVATDAQLENNYELNAIANLRTAESLNRLGMINKGLELGESVLSYLLANKVDKAELKAEAYSVIGDAYLNQGRNDQALEYLLKSLAQFELSEHKNSKALASCYNDLGIVYWNNGNNDLALRYHNNALEIRKGLFKSNHPDIADSYNNIGLVFSNQDYFDASSNFNRALDIYRKLYGESHPKIALVLNNLALANDKEGLYDQALLQLEKVSTIWNEQFEDDHPNKAFTISTIGHVLYHKKAYDLAISEEEKALKMYYSLYGNKHPEIANTLNILGSIYLDKGDFEESILYYQKAIYANLMGQEISDVYDNPELKNYYNADILLYSIQQKSQAFETFHYNHSLKLRDLKAALKCLELADNLISRIRQIRLSEKDKIALSAKASEIYQAGIKLCYDISEVSVNKKEYLEKAFDFVERSKSSVLFSAINDTKAKSFAGIPGELIDEETKLKKDIAFNEQKLAQKSGESEETEISKLLLDLNSKYNNFIKKLEADYPEYYNLKFNQSHISLSELRNSLDDKTAIITHFVNSTDQRIYTFYISQKSYKFLNTALDQNFKKDVSRLRNAIKYDIKDQFIQSAQLLYNQLIPDEFSKDINRLIIIPEGILSTIPFEVLLSSEQDLSNADYASLPYLVKKYNVSYDNSTTLFAQRKTEIENYQGESEDILLVAPVSFDEHFDSPIRLSDLPGSEAEINEIKYLFKAANREAKVLSNNQATEQNLKSLELKKYKYLHFATHGMVNESKPELSRIFLKPNNQNQLEDDNLFSGEIYNIDINADLVCLSACETGLGKISKGEGIIGLSRALLYAGAENLIVSLWTVADESTSKLMINFYNNHLHTSTYNTFSGALRKAKLSLINDEQYSPPYFWAPFILIGE